MTVDEKISRVIAGMVSIDSFWGYLFSHMQRKCADESFDAAMGVYITERGTINLVYHKTMLNEVDDRTIQIILEHEGWHILNKHPLRRSKILSEFGVSFKDEPRPTNEAESIKYVTKGMFLRFLCDIYNIAADMVTNYIIHAPDVLDIKTAHGDNYPLVHASNAKYNLEDNKTVEYYFNELYKKNKDDQQSFMDDVESMLRSHEGWGVGAGEDKSLMESKVEAYIKKLVYDAYKHTRNRGNLPGDLRDLIDGILSPPQIPYYQMIKRLVRASRISKIKRSPTKFNKKRAYAFTMHKNGKMDFLPYPGTRKDETFKIVIGIDTSGSMSLPECLEGLSASKSIIENDPHCETTVLQCDTRVVAEYQIKRLSDIKADIYGRGGTTLAPMLKRAQELNCDVALIFTDAECDDFTQIPRSNMPKKVIWVIPHSANDAAIAGTGFIVRVDKK